MPRIRIDIKEGFHQLPKDKRFSFWVACPSTFSGLTTFSGSAIFGGGLSGSISQLPDGRSYIVQGTGMSISSGSTTNQITLAINDSVTATLSGSTFTGPVTFLSSSTFHGTGSFLGPVVFNNSVTLSSSLALNVATTNQNHSLTDETVLLCNATSGNITITLPNANLHGGELFYIKKIDVTGFQVIVATTANQTIDGETSKFISAQYVTMQVIANSGSWYIL